MIYAIALLFALWIVLPEFMSGTQCECWHQDPWSSYRYRCLRAQSHAGAHRSALPRMRGTTPVIWNQPCQPS